MPLCSPPPDVTHPASIQAAAASVQEQLKGSGLTLLINNAGTAMPSTLESETPEGMALVYATNVTGPLLVSQAFLPLLKKAAQESPRTGLSCSRAAIVNMSSEAGSIQNIFLWHLGQAVSYRCSKAALNMLTKCQALAHGGDGILSVALHPGWVQTDMGSRASLKVGTCGATQGRCSSQGSRLRWKLPSPPALPGPEREGPSDSVIRPRGSALSWALKLLFATCPLCMASARGGRVLAHSPHGPRSAATWGQQEHRRAATASPAPGRETVTGHHEPPGTGGGTRTHVS
uniref:Uncharacterized oxidoreductase C663.09c-like n=1 Tax=Pelodiscus sinensis TaxID=13735 RepID=K7F9U8_PELSI